jgi:type I restriction enzyme S subunit
MSKNVPSLRFKGFNYNWEIYKLGSLGVFQSNGVDKLVSIHEVKVNLLNYMDVYNRKKVTNKIASDLMQVTAKPSEIINNNIIKNDVFFTPTSETPADIARVSVITETLHNTVYSYHLMRFRAREGVFFPVFPNYSLMTEHVRRQFFVNAKGVQRFVISKADFEKIETFLPNFSEQEKIGTLFDRFDSLISLHQQKHEKLINVKKALLDKMFPKNDEVIPSLRFKEFTDDWVITKLGSIGSTYSGLSGKNSSDFGHGQGNYVTYLNVFENPVANLTLVGKVEIDKSQNEILYGDVLFTTSSETPFDVGMSSVWLGNKPNTYLNSFCFGYRTQININPIYLAYMFRANVFREQMFTLAQGISRYNISKNKVMESYIKIPSIDEQVNIGKLFNDMDTLITLHQQKHEKLINVKKALLQKMFV